MTTPPRERRAGDDATRRPHRGSARARRAPARFGLLVTVALAAHAVTAQAQWIERLSAAREALDDGDAGAARTELTAIAAQEDDPRSAASARYFLAALDDEGYRFADALRGYRASIAMDPGSPYAGRILARVQELEAHAEGGFAPLAALERVRRTPALSNDPEALVRLGREARNWPAGSCRAEARYLVAEGLSTRFARPQEGAAVYRELALDPTSPGNLRDLAAQRLVELGVTLGREDRAARDVAAVRAVDPEVRTLAAVHLRRRRLRHGSVGVLALTAALGVISAAWTRRSGRWAELLRAWRRPLPLAHLALLSLGGAGLAHLSDGHEGGPFYVLGAGTLGVYLAVTAAAVAGPARWWAAIPRAMLGLLAALAVSYLAMERLDVMMLEGIGL